MIIAAAATSMEPIISAVQALATAQAVAFHDAAEAALNAQADNYHQHDADVEAAHLRHEALLGALAAQPAAIAQALAAPLAALTAAMTALHPPPVSTSALENNDNLFLLAAPQTVGITPTTPVTSIFAPYTAPVHTSASLLTSAVVPKGPSVRIHPPDKYNGSGNVYDALYLIEVYLKGSRIDKSEWHLHAVNLLTGKALDHWVTYAKPQSELGIEPTWSDLVNILTTMYGRQDLQTKARLDILDVRQTGSVQQYLGQFRSLIAKSGPPAFHETDLILWFQKGLKDDIAQACRLDHRTGQHWTSFDGPYGLTSYAIRMDPSYVKSQSSSLPPSDRKVRFQIDKTTKNRPPWRSGGSLKSASVKSKGQRREQSKERPPGVTLATRDLAKDPGVPAGTLHTRVAGLLLLAWQELTASSLQPPGVATAAGWAMAG